MKYTLNDYLNNKEYNQWQFIDLCLAEKNMSIDDLKDLFGVTSTSISNWKAGGPISRDKQIYLARLFGITLDQFYNKESSDRLCNKVVYGLDYIVDPKNYKGLSSIKLDRLYEAEASIKAFINYFMNDELNDFISIDEFDYICHHLKVNYEYDLKDKTIKGDCYLNYDILNNIKQELIEAWDNKEIADKFRFSTIDLTEIMLRSENIKYIVITVEDDVFNYEHNTLPIKHDPKLYLDKYKLIKKNVKNFDLSGNVLKALIAAGAIFWNDDKPDYSYTFEYLQKVIRNEIFRDFVEEEM